MFRSIQFNFAVLLFLMLGTSALANQESIDLLAVSKTDFKDISSLMRVLRDERKEHLFVPVAKLQLFYITEHADRVEATDPVQTAELRRFARGVAFNIASFTWPGWGDSPEPISEKQQQLGLQAALRGLELASQAEDVTSNILWITGAHQLNAKQYDAAIESFEQAKTLARNDFFRSMHAAWQMLTRVLAANGTEGLADFERAVSDLRAADFEDATFFADQLTTAKGVYLDDK